MHWQPECSARFSTAPRLTTTSVTPEMYRTARVICILFLSSDFILPPKLQVFQCRVLFNQVVLSLFSPSCHVHRDSARHGPWPFAGSPAGSADARLDNSRNARFVQYRIRTLVCSSLQSFFIAVSSDCTSLRSSRVLNGHYECLATNQLHSRRNSTMRTMSNVYLHDHLQ